MTSLTVFQYVDIFTNAFDFGNYNIVKLLDKEIYLLANIVYIIIIAALCTTH